MRRHAVNAGREPSSRPAFTDYPLKCLDDPATRRWATVLLSGAQARVIAATLPSVRTRAPA